MESESTESTGSGKNGSARIRTIRDVPFCWQAKASRRLIREAFDATNNVATALAVYDALTEIASDEMFDTFKTTHAWIQRLSGVGVSTIKKHLSVFVELGLLTVSTPTMRAPSTYTLLNVPLANGWRTLANGTKSAALATSEESKKKEMKTDKDLSHGESVPHDEEEIGDEDDGAESIWNAYPRKEGRLLALVEIRKALKLRPRDELLNAVQAYAAEVGKWADEDHRFIPAPAKWFNAGRYDDDQSCWKRHNPNAALTSADHEERF